LLDEIRRDEPDEPFWRGVRAMESGPDGVRLEFNEPVDPALRDVGQVRVACHLHDPQYAPLAVPPAKG
jgi:peptide/nickel transport system ATP-binding protein